MNFVIFEDEEIVIKIGQGQEIDDILINAGYIARSIVYHRFLLILIAIILGQVKSNERKDFELFFRRAQLTVPAHAACGVYEQVLDCVNRKGRISAETFLRNEN